MQLTSLSLALTRAGFRALAAFSPASLFAANEPGVWYDPSDMSTMFQDAAGITPVTAVEQPVGLILDKSRGLVLGSEQSGNPGNPFTSTTGYVAASSTLSIVSGRLKASVPAANTGTSGVYWDTSVVASKSHRLDFGVQAEARTFTVNVYDGASFSTLLASATIAPGAPATLAFTVRPTSSAIRVYVFEGSGVDRAVYLSSISVRELPGAHASQTTATARPILSARKNFYVNTETLATQNVTTRATKYIVSFFGTGSVTLSGAATGTLTGTGVADRVYLEFTATAGTLTSTVSGSVLKAQLEEV